MPLEGRLGVALQSRAATNLLLTIPRFGGGATHRDHRLAARGRCSDMALVALVAQPIFGRFAGRAAPVASANGW